MAHQSIWTNPKAASLARDIAEPMPHVVGHLESLWIASYDHCLPNGKVDMDSVESMARWDGTPGIFSKAMLKRGFILKHGRAYFIKNWLEYIPDYVRKRIERMGFTIIRGEGNCLEIVQTKSRQNPPPDPTQPNPPPVPTIQTQPNPMPDERKNGSGEGFFQKMQGLGIRDGADLNDIAGRNKLKGHGSEILEHLIDLVALGRGTVESPVGVAVTRVTERKRASADARHYLNTHRDEILKWMRG